MEIRRVESEAEISQVAALAREIWNEHYVPIIGQAQADYMLGLFQSEKAVADQISGNAEYFLVLEADRSVGYFAVLADTQDDRMMLSKIYVRKTDRGKGYGKGALAVAEGRCRERGLRTLWLTVNRRNTHSIRWYRKQGFEVAREQKTQIGSGFVMDDFVMEKTAGNDADTGKRGETHDGG